MEYGCPRRSKTITVRLMSSPLASAAWALETACSIVMIGIFRLRVAARFAHCQTPLRMTLIVLCVLALGSSASGRVYVMPEPA